MSNAEVQKSAATKILQEAEALNSLGGSTEALAHLEQVELLLVPDNKDEEAGKAHLRMVYWTIKADCLESLDHLAEALEAYSRAEELIARPHLASRSESDSDRATLTRKIGVCLWSLGRLAEALEAYARAEALYARPHLSSRSELDSERAKLAMNTGNCLWSHGRLDEALEAYARAEALYARPHLSSRSELDGERAKLAINTGNCLWSHGRLDEALDAYARAEALYARPHLASRSELDNTRAKLAMNTGVCLWSFGHLTEALEACARAETLYARPHLASRSELDSDRAGLAMSTGVCLWSLGHLAEALEAYACAEALYARPHVSSRSELDSDRAKLAMNTGNCLESLGRLAEALEAYACAEALFARPHMASRSELDSDRAGLAMNIGNCRESLGRLAEALEAYARAEALYAQPDLASRSELDSDRANLAMNTGISLWSLGRFAEALEAYARAEALFARPHLASRRELDGTRADLAMNTSVCLESLGRFAEALEGYAQAEALFARPHLASRRELDGTRAKLVMNTGNCLQLHGRFAEALEAYARTEALYAQPHLVSRSELDSYRAGLAMITGVCLWSLGQFADALDAYGRADSLFARPHLASRSELYCERAKLGLNSGNCLESLGCLAEALEAYQDGTQFWLSRPELALPELVNLAKTLWLMSRLFPEMGPDAQSWAVSSSDRLISMLDLDPRGDIAPWPELRGHFAFFHLNWLRYCLAGGPEDRVMVPRVLNALQGRRLAAEVIEAALASGDADPAIRDYAKLKAEMRDLLRQIEAAEGLGLGAFDLGGGPGGADGSGVRGFEAFGGVVAGGCERRRDEGTLERLRGEFRAKERALAETREKVAELPGFEVLGKPLGAMSLEAVRGKLAQGEALVLALPLERRAGAETAAAGGVAAGDGAKPPPGFETLLWVLRANGDPEVITLPEASVKAAPWDASLHGLGRAFAAFNAGQSGRGGMRRGGWGAEFESSGAAETSDEDATDILEAGPAGSGDAGDAFRGEGQMSLPPGVSAAEAFWPRMAGAMDRLFWEPLRASGALEGVETLLLATTGPLHNLPFSAGRREEDPDLWHVNSLVTWALGRGLYGAGGDDKAKAAYTTAVATATSPAQQMRQISDLPYRVGVLSNPESLDIPLAGAEVGLAARLWQAEAPPGSGRSVITDTAHPWQPEEALRFVHLACHGSIDTRPGETPRAVIGLSNRKTPDADRPVVTERHLLAGPPAGEVLMNLCVGGQAYDDLLDGDPTGLIPAWLRHGAHTVVAALPPVPDTHGALFGTTVTLLMTDPETPLPLATAARRAARILGEDPGLASPRLAARMAGLLPDLALPEVMAAIRRAEKGHRGGPVAPAISRELDRMLTGRRTVKDKQIVRRIARPLVLWWLDAAADRQLVDLQVNLDRVPTEAEVLSLLAALRPDPDRDGPRAAFPNPNAFPVDAQTIRYGYAVFGDPGARHRKA